MTERLRGKIAILTGAARGIGAATAELFAREGAAVALWDLKDDLGEALCAKITAEGGKHSIPIATLQRREKSTRPLNASPTCLVYRMCFSTTLQRLSWEALRN